MGNEEKLDLAAARSRIDQLDPQLRAWVHLDPLATATGTGPLAGWPVGIKDLIDVQGMPTLAGAHAPTRVPYRAQADALAVARLRAAGAAIVGKTAAVEYGWFGHVRTRNPRDLRRSPGGSSSGSAAAVAARMCRAALGTQTAGSVIRPAAYTGVPAIKFSHGVLDLSGVIATSRSLDSLGAFAADLADLTAVTHVLLAAPTGSTGGVGRMPRLGHIAGYFDTIADPAVRRRVDAELNRIAEDGVTVETVEPNVDWAELAQAHRTIMLKELAAIHAQRFESDPRHYSATLATAITSGQHVLDGQYRQALEIRRMAQQLFATSMGASDAWVTPAATSYAPPAGEPGDPACNVAFSLAGLPAVAVPIEDASNALPTALQFVGVHGSDLILLSVAARCAHIEPLEVCP